MNFTQQTIAALSDIQSEYYFFAFGLLILLSTNFYLWTKLQQKRADYFEALNEMSVLEVHAEEGYKLRHVHDQLTADMHDLQIQHATLQTEQQMHQAAFQEKLTLVESAKTHFMQAFEALSAQALEKSNRSFLNLAHETLAKYQESAQGDLKLRQQAVGEMIHPLREALTAVDHKIQSMEKERVGAYEGLKTQVFELVNTQKELRLETAQLVKALRAPHVRGRWGEIQLRRVVELSGMSVHCDFTEQTSFTTDEGRLRPDMIITLPAGKQLIIDAKAPLAAYLEALEATDDATRTERLRDHARQVKKHIMMLSNRSYWQLDQQQDSPEFVILFLPGETFFNAAMEHDPSLIELGVEKGVIITTPNTLIALLHAIAYGWRQEKLAENAREVCQLGKELYKRLADMGGHFDKLGNDLMSAVRSYNKTVGTIESRVYPSARRFRDLAAIDQKNEIPHLSQLDESARFPQVPELMVSNNDAPDDNQSTQEVIQKHLAKT